MDETVLSKLSCPACSAPGLSAVCASGPACGDTGHARSITCSRCGASYPIDGGIPDLAGTARLSRRLSAQWAMELGPVVLLYERYWRPLATLGFSDLAWEMETAVKLMDLSPGLDVLDMACGTGNFTRLFTHRVRPGLVMGIDLSLPMIRRARQELKRRAVSGVALMRADVTRWPFMPETFDRICCAGALHLFPGLGDVFSSVHRTLKPGGVFVGATYCRGRGPVKRRVQDWISTAHGIHWFGPGELQGLAESAGFSGWEQHTRRQGIVFRALKEQAPAEG